VQVILPYKRGEQFIPAIGRIVRMEEIPGGQLWGVAVQISSDKK
jgi:hypothetical protein